MSDNLFIKNGITIPEHELDISSSKSGGAGGQHVNKTETRITVRWNPKNSNSLTEEQKELLLKNLQNKLTFDGDLVISNSETRSQIQNKENALLRLAFEIKKALYVPKQRMKTKIPKSAIEKRLKSKKQHGEIKKMRSKKFDY
ncbi:aminoacyl-tRNA hydrolase [Candidatus Dependentiae bacterium]|nr:aminoacyl-tRNA hydrolase [Candidatus Dependentiae bacterium]MBU4387401.1 aminoacyl-tRNA hydrolase [Candidatus Dependentiae bacterium]MCG2756780.1 aminoacyl-tRNA hydrolase [Candidatus Dependentiae bacterium]